MKLTLISRHLIIAAIALLIVLSTPLLLAQNGQMGFSSVITDRGSSGTITYASTRRIEDSHQNWSTNAWAGYYIQVTGNDGSGQIRKIVGNTSTTITVSKSFDGIPNASSGYKIRRGYVESTQGLTLKLYIKFNDANRMGGKFVGYTCRVQASDSSSVEFVSAERGYGLGEAWAPCYYAPPGLGRMNWIVLQMYDKDQLASGLYNIATLSVNLLKTDVDKAIAFYLTDTPQGRLPSGWTKDEYSFSFDTTTNESFSGREEIFILHNTSDAEQQLAVGTSESSTKIGSYPNPFNPVTTIQYELTEYSEVHLAVFDVLGRLVGELVNSNEYEGLHSIAWEPRNVSSGTYFARLSIRGSITNSNEVKMLKLAYTK